VFARAMLNQPPEPTRLLPAGLSGAFRFSGLARSRGSSLTLGEERFLYYIDFLGSLVLVVCEKFSGKRKRNGEKERRRRLARVFRICSYSLLTQGIIY
jgi:hypothetical protein